MNRLRLAVIGAGHLGRIHARLSAANPAFELVAVVDPVAEAREPLAAELHVEPLADHRGLAERIDAAIIATPTRFHHAVACDLLRQRIHLLVEKPLASNLAEADELAKVAEQSGAVLQVGHIERFNPVLAALADRLGEPKYIEARRYSTHTLRSMDIGVVLDLMIHDLDVAMSLAHSPVESVAAMGLTVLGPHEDVATARLKFANGCVANLSASRVSFYACREMQVWSTESFAGIDFANRSAKVVRPAEVIRSGQFNPDAFSVAEKSQFRDRLFTEYLPVETITAPERNALADEQSDFAGAILNGHAPRVTGRQGRDVVAVADRILESIAGHAWDSADDGRLGPTAAFAPGPASLPTPLAGPHWQREAAASLAPRRQAG